MPQAEPVDFGDEIEVTPEAEVPAEQAPAAEPDAPVEPAAPEPEAPAEPETEAAAKPPAGIPKHRFDFAQQKRREAEERAAALEAEIARLKASQPAQGPTPQEQFETRLAELDIEIEKARLDGDAKLAAQLVGQQRNLERRRTEWLAEQTGETAAQRATEQGKLDTIITQLEETYPQFVEGGPEYDKELVEQVLDLHSAFLAKGDRPSQAMAKASSLVLRLNGLLTDDEVTTEVAKAAARTTNVKKNVAAAQKTPPAIDKAGLDSDKAGVKRKLDLSQMTIEEYERLGESRELAEARGDFDV